MTRVHSPEVGLIPTANAVLAPQIPGPWDRWSDESLADEWDRLCNRHDRLIDTAEMGDERIYFIGKEMDAIRDEQKRRAAIAKATGETGQ